MAAMNPTARMMKQFNDKVKEGDLAPQGEILEGVLLPGAAKAAQITEQREKLVIRPDDVFLPIYPKCGMTWTQQIVKLIANNGVETGVEIDEFFAWTEIMTLEEIEESKASPRFFKTHLPYHLMPGGGDPEKTKAKYITVIRNPKDVAVSSYNHMKKMLPQPYLPPWDVLFNSYLQGTVPFGSFWDHFNGWWAHKDAPNILVLTYEEMKRDPRYAVTTIARFLGYNLTDEVIDKIVADTSFDKMKGNKAANRETETYNWMGEGQFMRKGVIGDWRNVLTTEESVRIDAVVAEKMKDSGIVFDYGDED